MADFFAKSETSLSLDDCGIGNYTGLGIKQSRSWGTLEGLTAFKANEKTRELMLEGKYTTPKFGDFALENRTRVMSGNYGDTMTERVACKYSKSLGNGFSIYNITGANAKIALNGDGLKSITPVTLTGLGYNVNKQLSTYVEYEGSKGYDTQSHKWGNFVSNMYFGIKYTF